MFFKITVNHKGCWSQLLSKYIHTYGILLNQVISGSNTITGHVAFYDDGTEHLEYAWNDFFDELKNHKNIWKLEHLETLGNGKIYLLELSSHLVDSMSELMNKYNCPFFNEIFYGGFESWYIYSWYESSDNLIEDIKSITDVINFERLEEKDFSKRILPFYEDKYFYILKDLFNKGYYSSKKELKLRDIATLYGTSKSNISKKLKRAEINAISYYVNFRFDHITLHEEEQKKRNKNNKRL